MEPRPYGFLYAGRPEAVPYGYNIKTQICPIKKEVPVGTSINFIQILQFDFGVETER